MSALIASTAAESSHIFANSRYLYGASGYIGAAGWIMLFDSTSAPPSGAVTPIWWQYVPAAGSWFLDCQQEPITFTNGIVIAASSTGPLTYTAYSTNTVFSVQVQ